MLMNLTYHSVMIPDHNVYSIVLEDIPIDDVEAWEVTTNEEDITNNEKSLNKKEAFIKIHTATGHPESEPLKHICTDLLNMKVTRADVKLVEDAAK